MKKECVPSGRTFFVLVPIIRILNLGIAFYSYNEKPSKKCGFFTQYGFIKRENHQFHLGGNRGNYRQNNGKYFTN
ncbi:hypothetical protein [Peribacillus simplex]|uniref:hypothetical protein n=1 Tax=Peribacillus simplex TaxID=1478 RepID=UPI000971199B|nr:hypothetical protein [Peribacillus simplex]WHY57235.1 hypothetical protein QNH43_02680 [Peribacillus simplex]